MLAGKRILLGVTGSIAAYKSVFLTRLLIKAGAEVKVIMTPDAAHFVQALTFSTLSKNPVWTDVSSETGWNNHVELGLWADVYIVAPVTANTLSKLANGLCDNMLAAAYLSARCPVYIAPAMDVDMWHHPATQRNIKRLQDDGVQLIPVGKGELASGLTGEGRMAEPEAIFERLSIDLFQTEEQFLADKHVLITAGPTREAIDPARFISNPSTGKMGVALARACLRYGASVDLILGPVHLPIPVHPRLQLHRATSAQQMYEAAKARWPQADLGIMSAAVADYRPAVTSKHKLKKSEDDMQLQLTRTPDIAASLGAVKQNHQRLLGFALESENGVENAKQKIVKKGFDLIVLNELNNPKAGFQSDTNEITLIFSDGRLEPYPLKTKEAIALDIVKAASALF